MRREDLRPIERMAFNYANNVLKKDIKIEDVGYISINWDSVDICFKRIGSLDVEVPLADLGIKYKEIDEKAKEIYANSIDYVVQLVYRGFGMEKVTPCLSDLLKLKFVSDKWLNYFRSELEDFYEDLTGERLHIISISLGNEDIEFIDDEEEEHLLPLEILSLPASEAKVRYAAFLEELSQSHRDQEIRTLVNDIKRYKEWAEEAEKKLKELEKN